MNGLSTAELLRQIQECAGSAYLRRVAQRSSSLNVFQMNAVELIDASQRVRDPDQGFALMLEKNRDANRQAQRELSRHVHNFASSAFTLVDHTRRFMRKHYAETDLLVTYEKRVAATFLRSPIAQFVQGLRNYMLHRSLPASSMYMNFKTDPDSKGGSGAMETGVRYGTASLLEWEGWKPLARAYLEESGPHLELHGVVEEYLTLVNQFHGWLDATLEEHHRADLLELGRLQAELQAKGFGRAQASQAPSSGEEALPVAPFEFTAGQAETLNDLARDLFAKVRELKFQGRAPDFQTDRLTTPITDKEIIGQIILWGDEVGGAPAITFIQDETKSYGFSESDYQGVKSLVATVLELPWAPSRLSRAFVERTFIKWARQRYSGDGTPFAEALGSRARAEITSLKVWAPVANLEVEEAFDFGPLRIEAVTAAVIDGFRNSAPAPPPEHREAVDHLFDELRRDIQGRAAVVVPMEVEPGLAEELGFQIAQDAVGLLRFFSPAGHWSFLFSPVALFGAEYLPSSRLIVSGESTLSLTQRVLPQKIGNWRLSATEFAQLKSTILDIAGSLVMAEGLSDFALAVRAAILTFSKGTTLADPMDRLRNCVSALEGVFMRHEMEPRQHSVANRMDAVLVGAGMERGVVRQTVQQIYWMLSQPQLRPQVPREEELIALFTTYAHDALRLGLNNVPRFTSKVQFIVEVDRLAVSAA